jgi:hypothetical protein
MAERTLAEEEAVEAVKTFLSKLALVVFLVLALCGLAQAQTVQVQGNLQDWGANNATASTTYLQLTLENYGSAIPQMAGGHTYVSPNPPNFPTDSIGNVNGPVVPNDLISPPGTYYQACIFSQGVSQWCQNYRIFSTQNPFNLNGAVPLVIPTKPRGGNVQYAQAFTCLEPIAATTWVCRHNFGTQAVEPLCFNQTQQLIFPETVTATDVNTVTATFVSPQAGSCVILNASSVNLTNSPANAILSHTNSAQTITGQALTVAGPFTASRGETANNLTLTGLLSSPNINNVLVVDGNVHTTLQQAFAACPPVGCVIDMRGNSSSAALALGTFDPGTTPVTILLGPSTATTPYTLTQMSVRTGLHLIGMGSCCTFIQQSAAGTPPFQSPPSGQVYPQNVASGVLLQGFNLNATAGSTSNGFNFVCNLSTNGTPGGLWYSHFSDISIGSILPFGGEQMRFDTLVGSGCTNQFLSFQDMYATRPANGSPDLHITGAYNGQMHFYGHQEWDGPFSCTGRCHSLDTTGKTNIQIDDGNSSVWQPYNIEFDNLTSQWAWNANGVAITLGGVAGFQVNGGHFEQDNGVLKATLTGQHGNSGVVIEGASFENGTGIDNGNGFILYTDVNSQVALINSATVGTPDAVVAGTSSKYVTMFNNQNSLNLNFPMTFAQIPFFKVQDQGSCTMSAGTCAAQSFGHTYANPPNCFASWNTKGTLTGIVKINTTTSSAAISSTVNTDTAGMNWICFGD